MRSDDAPTYIFNKTKKKRAEKTEVANKNVPGWSSPPPGPSPRQTNPSVKHRQTQKPTPKLTTQNPFNALRNE